jgi:DNA gyrase inhibitor GyrI
MEVRLVEIKEEIIVGGFSIESTGETFVKDLESLYNDFTHSGKMKSLNNVTKNDHEYYAVTWYDHEMKGEFAWLLGQKINGKTDNLETKTITKGEYAVTKFPPKHDAIKAWTDFYAEGIPKMGYKPIQENNIAFVLYPNGLDGENEYWALVEKELA